MTAFSNKIFALRAKTTGRESTSRVGEKQFKVHDANDRQWSGKLMVLILMVVLFVLVVLWSPTRHVLHRLVGARVDELPEAFEGRRMLKAGVSAKQTLVLYTYSNSDPEYERNLHYFVQHGVSEGDPCYYIITVQQGHGILPSQKLLPTLPQNARYAFHENTCFDWGTFRWVMNQTISNLASYKYIIFMNSSVRGPHLPVYWPAFVHWSTIFTSRLSNDIKLVGSTISCESTYLHGDTTAEKRQNPHVQSYVMATDQEGVKILMEDKLVFKCYESLHDTIWNSELGASGAMFNAGYGIDSLMLKYQGIDWLDRDNWNCNAGLNPYKMDMYDGINLSPLEVVFVKLKDYMLQADWTTPKTSQTYDMWRSHEGLQTMVQENKFAGSFDIYRHHDTTTASSQV